MIVLEYDFAVFTEGGAQCLRNYCTVRRSSYSKNTNDAKRVDNHFLYPASLYSNVILYSCTYNRSACPYIRRRDSRTHVALYLFPVALYTLPRPSVYDETPWRR